MHGQETQIAELRPGDMFADHRIEGVLGKGGMGVVYRAMDLRLNRPVALKLIKPDLSHDDDFRRRFRRESELAASVRQPNVVTIYQAGDADGLLFVTMDLIDGVDLRGFMGERGQLDSGTAVEVTAQVACALDAAHARGLVHRDVKPANILVANGTPMHVYLTDFGLTKRAGSQSDITRAGLFIGTIDYAAPEQITGGAVDARTDVYALGCVLFEMLTGRAPFRRDMEAATLYAQVHEPPPASGLSQGFDDVLRRALAKDPDERFPSAGDLARAAQAAAQGERPREPERTVAVGQAAPAPALQVQAPPTQWAQPQAQTAPPQAQPAPPPAPPAQAYSGPPSYPTTPLPQPQPAPQGSNPWPWVALLIAILAVGAVIAVVLITSGGDNGGDAPVAQQQQGSGQGQGQGTDPPPQPPADAVRADVEEIREILALSAQGRSLTAAGNFDAAATNRREVLAQIDALDVGSELNDSHALLRSAIDASLDSNLAHSTGDASAAGEADSRATRLKTQFTSEFNPFAERYLQRSYDPSAF